MNLKRPILSIIALLNIFILPVYTESGGFFPTEKFFSIVQRDLNPWSVSLTVFILLPSVFMFFYAFGNRKAKFTFASGIGFVLIILTALYGIFKTGFKSMFDFQSGHLTIGFWIALIIFAITFIPSIFKIKQEIAEEGPEKEDFSWMKRREKPNAYYETSREFIKRLFS